MSGEMKYIAHWSDYRKMIHAGPPFLDRPHQGLVPTAIAHQPRTPLRHPHIPAVLRFEGLHVVTCCRRWQSSQVMPRTAWRMSERVMMSSGGGEKSENI
jgi:hypothetical protein